MNNTKFTFPFFGILTLILITLKLCGVIAISWWWIVLCFFFPVVLALVIIALTVVCAGILALAAMAINNKK